MAKKTPERKVLRTISQDTVNTIAPATEKMILYSIQGTHSVKDSSDYWVLADGEEDDNVNAYAKKVTRNNRDSYYIKLDKDGYLFDVLGQAKTGKIVRYTTVNRKVFELYINYLRTKDKWYYKQAVRESL